MGFKRCCHYFDAIHMGFKMGPLKTHANTSTFQHKALETHANSSRRERHRRARRRGLAATPRPRVEESLPSRTHAIRMGFKRCQAFVVGICRGFKAVPLKTHAKHS